MEYVHISYDFSAEKNAHLKMERGVSFDEVIAAIKNNQVLDIIKYPNQEIMIVNLKGYVYIIPFMEKSDGSIFLKTIYPSRKAKNYYLSGGDTHEK
jgi:hypothetical protein